MVCGIHSNFFEKKFVHGFWNLTQIMNQNEKFEKFEEIPCRMIDTYSKLHLQFAPENCAIVGSNVLSIEGHALVQRSFWP